MMWRLQSAKEDLTHRMHAGQGSLESGRRELQRQIEEVFLVEEGGGQESRIGIK
ncbi:MAG: hypothetical protein V3V11_06655 [Vicinamibacteria bacterium]